MSNKLKLVMLVDDDDATNFINKALIIRNGFADTVEVCNSGEDGLAFLTTADESDQFPKPELIFLDINMPGMDGWEFLKKYNQLDVNQRGGIVVVMLTSSLNPSDMNRAEDNRGLNNFIPKPLTKENLDELMQKHFS